MKEKLESLSVRWKELEEEIQDPALIKNQSRYKDVMREHAYLSKLMEEYAHYLRFEEEITQTRTMMQEETDHELKEMAREELHNLEAQLEQSENNLKVLLIPPDPLEEKNIIMEIRGGTGGEEAALFAADLLKMYTHYAEAKNWKYELLSSNETELGGFKEVTLSISGKYVYGSLRYESGVHRVQRVPETEGSGRIHTSAVTVAVLPEAEETEIVIKQEDLRIDVMRAGGPGGQCVNTTDSAVRLTHYPCGLPIFRPVLWLSVRTKRARLKTRQRQCAYYGADFMIWKKRRSSRNARKIGKIKSVRETARSVSVPTTIRRTE